MSHRLPVWVPALAVHLAARLVSALVLVAVARDQAANLWTPAAPSYAEYVGGMWDAAWYREIAEQGYPDGLPRGPDGEVQQNAWAFFPLFPLLVRGLTALTGLPWTVLAPTTALVLGTAAVLMVHRLVLEVGGRRDVALLAVALLTTSVASPVLQVAYTESLALLLLAVSLLLLRRRQYLAAVPVVLALGLTRAVALPLAVAVLAHVVARARAEGWWVRRGVNDGLAEAGADRGRPPRTELLGMLVLTAATGVAGVLWPVLVGLRTGEPDAYLLTQAAWRARGEVVPVLPWFDVARWLLGGWGPVVVAALVVLAVLVLASRPGRRLGPEMLGWTAGYLAYLLVAVEPGSSVLRFGLLAFPLAVVAADAVLGPVRGTGGTVRRGVRGAVGRPARAAAGASLLVVGLVGQVWWVHELWRLVPPSGWPP